ncbi:calphotin-like [Maniola hyperantus]|uniref:calphotin-like n=1 Tax=Aphantopus hyperantus TaxID=2795564 RepID=UPI001568188D|nr:ice-structuring glycoprotein-like [Maniola hyperantus]
MNSLVVLFSVMVLAAAKPSVPAIISYAAPAVAIAPAAVSQQSRIDIKSTPAIVKTNVIAPAIAPAVVAAPVAYSAPFAVAPAAVSTQSQIDIKSSPAVISTIAGAPLTYSAPLIYGVPNLAYSAYGTPLTAAYAPSIYAPAIASAITPTILKTAAIIPEAESAPSAPLGAVTETPEVAAARAAHLQAKALEEFHQIQKRSAPSIPLSDDAPKETPEVATTRTALLQDQPLDESHQIQARAVGIVATSPVLTAYTSPIVTSYASSPLIYSSPISRIAPVGLPGPYLTGGYGIHPY